MGPITNNVWTTESNAWPNHDRASIWVGLACISSPFIGHVKESGAWDVDFGSPSQVHSYSRFQAFYFSLITKCVEQKPMAYRRLDISIWEPLLFSEVKIAAWFFVVMGKKQTPTTSLKTTKQVEFMGSKKRSSEI